jgi:hypothetical protein
MQKESGERSRSLFFAFNAKEAAMDANREMT